MSHPTRGTSCSRRVRKEGLNHEDHVVLVLHGSLHGLAPVGNPSRRVSLAPQHRLHQRRVRPVVCRARTHMCCSLRARMLECSRAHAKAGARWHAQGALSSKSVPKSTYHLRTSTRSLPLPRHANIYRAQQVDFRAYEHTSIHRRERVPTY